MLFNLHYCIIFLFGRCIIIIIIIIIIFYYIITGNIIMEYLQKCITPRAKTPEDIAIDESKAYFEKYGRVWSDDDLQKFRAKYESRHPPTPRPTRIERDDFIFSHCIMCCTQRFRNATSTSTASSQEQKKYASDGSFMTFHIRVLFCLE